MSLGTDAMKSWWGPHQNTRHNREVAWTPCERESALQAAINEQRNTEGTSVEKFTWPDTYHEPLPTRGGKGCAINWQNRRIKQRSIRLHCASKLQIWWPKQWSFQWSDPQRSAAQTISIIATRAYMQAHGKVSPCDYPTDHRDNWTQGPEINLT